MRLSTKLSLVEPGVYAHWCPGCKCEHWFYVGQPAPRTNARWCFSGDVHAPTFGPSMHITYGPFIDPEDSRWNIEKTTQCHYFLKNGMLEFLSDCAHALKGQTVALPDLP